MPKITIKTRSGVETVTSSYAPDAARDAVYLKFERVSELPTAFPPRLQILVCDDCFDVRAFPTTLPPTVTMLSFRGCSIETLPDLTALVRLETLDLCGNALRHLDGSRLPPSLRTLDTSFNKLRTAEGAFPPELAFWDCSYNFLPARPDLGAAGACTVNDDHNEYPWNRGFLYAPPVDKPSGGSSGSVMYPSKPRTPRAVYDNSQNAHAMSVQKSVGDGISVIVEMTRSATLLRGRALVDAIMEGPAPSSSKCSSCFFGTRRVPVDPLRVAIESWCASDLVHSVYGIAFENLMGRVVWIVVRHEHRKELLNITRDELRASIGLCFTGRMSRVVNILSGFVEDVHVGISSKEQLQERMAAISRLDAPDDEKIRRATETLDELGVMDPLERAAWLGSF